MADACATCRHWGRYEAGSLSTDLGDCRRYPPKISETLLARLLPGGLCDPRDELELSVYGASAFPVMNKADACGEYAPKGGSPC
jgi:hypothetical protein